MDEIELKTGPLEPGSILELNLLTIDELTILKSNPKLSVNQRKKCEKRIKWLLAAPDRREKRRAKRAEGKGRSSRLRTNETIATKDHFDEFIHLGIDFGHGAPCTLVEWKDMTKQTRRCYQHYRRSERPFQLHLLDMHHNDNFIKMMNIHAAGWEKWDLHMTQRIEDMKEEGTELVYLTAEADETLDTVVPGRVYVIGGLVDRNRLPGVCSARAKELGLKGTNSTFYDFTDLLFKRVPIANHGAYRVQSANSADSESRV